MARPVTIEHNTLLINGEWRDSSGGDELMELVNPATEEVICGVPAGTAADIEAAAAAAKAALQGKAWRKMGGRGRSIALWKLADLIERDADDIAMLETVNQGKPIFESR
ncbi:MAG: aldehyde dehydrogenase family protein, partial [Candidatus Krumholzibacteria bacterium]|nr:aldehyde dehydrogenase family protein [Candidatus Krumholzibacteria bacterium]